MRIFDAFRKVRWRTVTSQTAKGVERVKTLARGVGGGSQDIG